MKFLCLCYYDTVAFSLLDAAEIEEVGKACRPHDAALKATGKVVAQGSLSAPEAWSHFISRDGKPQLKAGPYQEATRLAGAFFLVDAGSAEEAQEVASKHAAANYGEHIGFAVEVRPCEMFESCATPAPRPVAETAGVTVR
jgi:hypothetical protein